MKKICIILAVILVIVLGLGIYASRVILRSKRMTHEESLAWESDHYDTSFYDALEKVDYEVPSYDGYVLHAQLLKNPEPTQKYIILTHGHTGTRIGSLKYVRFYLDFGFNCVIYDLRGHGENAPTFCTYSIRESRDLCAMVEDARKRWPEMTTLGLHGESLGAATTVASMQYKPQVDFAVADCGFSEIASILKAGLKRSYFPEFMYEVTRLCAKVGSGYDFNDMRPIDALRENDVPILFIHGEDDTFIPYSHGVAMRDATRGPSDFHLMPGARHAESVLVNYDEYKQWVAAFLESLQGN